MQLLDDHLFQLYAGKKIAAEEAMDRSTAPGELSDKIEKYNKGQLTLEEAEGTVKPDETENPQKKG